jgi:hypothetical protein
MVGVAQLVEHLVVVQDVAGSSPVTHPRDVSVGITLRRAEEERADTFSVCE